MNDQLGVNNLINGGIPGAFVVGGKTGKGFELDDNPPETADWAAPWQQGRNDYSVEVWINEKSRRGHDH